MCWRPQIQVYELKKGKIKVCVRITLLLVVPFSVHWVLLIDRLDEIQANELSMLFSPFDLKRLESYANNTLDYHVILDLMPVVAGLYFQKRFGGEVKLTAIQSAILLAVGLQRKGVEEVEVCRYFGLCESGNEDVSHKFV